MNIRVQALSLLAAVSLFGCGLSEEDTGNATKGSAALQGVDDNGTVLASAVTASAVTCSNGVGEVALSGSISTTGSVDSVEITASVDGATATQVGLIEPQDFVHSGRNKTASYSVNLTLNDGTHSIELCFTQSGAQGRTPKTTCAAPITVTVACAVDVCAQETFFGDLVGNKNLCNGNGPPHIPVHIKGDFGDDATLSISGPNGYTYSAALHHAGDSCVFQYNWDTAGNGGAGSYTFTATGENGKTLSFTAQLNCR